MTDPRYGRALARQRQERNPPRPPIACTFDDLRETGEDGHLGLLWHLCQDEGWILDERPAGDTVALRARSSGGCTVGVAGRTAEQRAHQLFASLVGDEPMEIALAAGLWPRPRDGD